MTESIKYRLFGVASVVALFCQVVAVSTFWWIGVRDDHGYIGAFRSSHDGKDSYQTYCTTNMTEIECGYMAATQICVIVSVLFGGISSFLYFAPYTPFSSMPTFLAVSGSFLAMLFSLMGIVIFTYFKKHYYDDDGKQRLADLK